jgi:hypothetical protein
MGLTQDETIGRLLFPGFDTPSARGGVLHQQHSESLEDTMRRVFREEIQRVN